jgi:hypothetical protein
MANEALPASVTPSHTSIKLDRTPIEPVPVRPKPTPSSLSHCHSLPTTSEAVLTILSAVCASVRRRARLARAPPVPTNHRARTISTEPYSRTPIDRCLLCASETREADCAVGDPNSFEDDPQDSLGQGKWILPLHTLFVLSHCI